MWIAILVLSILFSCKRVETDKKSLKSSEKMTSEVAPSGQNQCKGKAKEECDKTEMCSSLLGRTVSSEAEIFLGCINSETICATAISCFQNSTSNIRVVAGKGCDLENEWVPVECSNEETNAY